MFRKIGFRWVVVSLAISLFLMSIDVLANSNMQVTRLRGHSPEGSSGKHLIAGTPHAPIVIVSDANFSDTALVEGWPGDGSPGDPYRIEGLDIDLGGASGHCISISNTQVHFIIRDCNLTGATQFMVSGSGIFLNKVGNGTLINNICNNNWNGILLDKSSFNLVTNNTCRYNDNYGIGLRTSCLNNTIVNNDLSSNNGYGIALDSSAYNLVANNNCSSGGNGIYMGYSNFNTVDENTFSGCSNYGMYIFESDSNTIVNNNCSGNTGWDGILVYQNCAYNVLVNNNCSYNGNHGINLYWYSSLNTVSNNTCNNNDRGISPNWYSTFNTVTNNTCLNNAFGIYIESANSSTVTNNTFTHNNYNIYLDSGAGRNNISWNIFALGNIDNGADYGPDNRFDYNFWSDYTGPDFNMDGVGDTIYSLNGIADAHPLMYEPTPPVWTNRPQDMTVELGVSFFRYDINASAPAPLTWWVNDTLRFVIDDDGILTSWNLGFGSYGLKIVVRNIYGSSITGEFRIQMVEYIHPSWMITPTDQTISFGEPFDYQIPAIDNVRIDHWTLSDTTNFTLTAIYFSGGSTAYITNKSILEVGVYLLNVTVYDVSGNRLSAIFSVIVEPLEQDTTSPEWVIAPTDWTLEYGEALAMQVGAWDQSGIDRWWLDDTEYFMIDTIGVIRNATVLEPGFYGLEVRAFDPYDNYCSADIIVTVLEAAVTTTTTTTTTTPIPQQDGPDPLVTLVLGTGLGGVAVVVVVVILHIKRRGASESS